MVSLLIGGDVCPINRNLPYFKNGDVKNIFNDLLIEFEQADLSIVNLECPLVNEYSPIVKNGPVHEVESACINGIIKANIDILNLANNHILDHGSKGLLNTLKVCSENSVVTVGAGRNLKSANRIIVKEVKGIRIGVLGVAEHEFSIATKGSPGANPLDIISYVRAIKYHKGEFDYLVVLVHAGQSGYPLPSPQLMETCRFMAEMGANAVICQHSHCPGCYEQYKGSYLVYGQGNLIFDLNTNGSPWNKGFLIKLTITDKDRHDIDIIPYLQSDAEIGARKMSGDEEKLFLREIRERSLKLSSPSYVREEWIKLCERRKNFYYHCMLFGFANNRLFRRINSIIPYAKLFFTRKHSLILENIMRSESHREAIETILEEIRKTKL